MLGSRRIFVGLSSKKKKSFVISIGKLFHERIMPNMHLNLRTTWFVISILVAVTLSSCAPLNGLPATEVVSTEGPAQQTLRTTMGDFSIAAARLVDEVHSDTAQPGEKFLLVVLTQPDGANINPAEFSLEAFQSMVQASNGQVYVTVNDGSPIISTMAGWLEDEFVMGFRVPEAESYMLHWLENGPIELTPAGQ